MAFICRQYAQLTYGDDKLDATEHWHEIFHRLEKEKFSADLAQVTEREVHRGHYRLYHPLFCEFLRQTK